MKTLIKKILKEAKEEFGWAEELLDDWYTPGDLFQPFEICSDEGDDCKVNIHKNGGITFSIEYDNWLSITNNRDEWVLDSLLYNPNYNGDGDYYDFDTDEFNYISMTNEEISRFQKILNITSPGDDMEKLRNENELNSVVDKLKFKPLMKAFENMQDEYLSIIGYQVQRNRWLEVSDYFRNLLKENNVSFDLDYKWLSINVSPERVSKFFKHNANLSDLLLEVSSILSNQSWSDMFYESFDTSGSEDDVRRVIDSFLNEAEEFLENDEEMVKYKNLADLLDKLGFKIKDGFYTKVNKDGSKWHLNLKPNDMAVLDFYRKNDRLKSKSFKIPYDEIKNYVTNYFLEL